MGWGSEEMLRMKLINRILVMETIELYVDKIT